MGHILWQFISIFQICKKICTNPLPDLAYANVFVQKLQPFAYPGYVPG